MESASSPIIRTEEELEFCAQTPLRYHRRPVSQLHAPLSNDSNFQPSNEINLQHANESNPQPDSQLNAEPFNQSDGTTQTRRENLVQHEPRYKGIVSKFIPHCNFGFIKRCV